MVNQKKNSGSSSPRILFWIVSSVTVIIIGIIFIIPHLSQSPAQKRPVMASSKEMVNSKEMASSTEKIDYANEPYIGNSSAPVSIIEFGDYKCPYCKMFNEKVLPTVIQELVDTGEAKLYFINDSFIYTDSIRSAKFAESVYAVLGNKTFWKFHELLYQKQPVGSQYEKMDIYDEKYLTDTLKEASSDADVNKVIQYFEAQKADAAWQKDMNLVNQLNVTSTPAVFVDGKVAKTVDDLKSMVHKEAKKRMKDQTAD